MTLRRSPTLPIKGIMNLLDSASNFYSTRKKLPRKWTNIYMNWFQREALSTIEHNSKLWLNMTTRLLPYLTTTNISKTFLSHIKNFKPIIKFIPEEDSERQWTIFDVINRMQRGHTATRKNRDHTELIFQLQDQLLLNEMKETDDELKAELANIKNDFISNDYSNQCKNKTSAGGSPSIYPTSKGFLKK